MPRKYKRKTTRANISKDIMIRAAKEVLLNNRTKVSVSKDFEIPLRTFERFCSKITLEEIERGEVTVNVGYVQPGQVLSNDQEKQLDSYVKKAADIYFGLTPRRIRKLAFLYAKTLNISLPKPWIENKMAGKDWFTSFLQRHNHLSIRTPQPTSVARCSSFNRTTSYQIF